MARNRIRLDHAGIEEVLKSAEVRAEVDGLAETAGRAARAHPSVIRNGVVDRVQVESYTTDRAAAAVVIAHPAGVPMEAKYGVLTQAAGEAGLEVRSRE